MKDVRFEKKIKICDFFIHICPLTRVGIIGVKGSARDSGAFQADYHIQDPLEPKLHQIYTSKRAANYYSHLNFLQKKQIFRMTSSYFDIYKKYSSYHLI